MTKNEEEEESDAYWGQETCIDGFGGETSGKEITWKTLI
jgi:hypothetical protein